MVLCEEAAYITNYAAMYLPKLLSDNGDIIK